MGINELFDGIAEVVNRFVDEPAEQKLREKMSQTGRGLENGLEKTKNPENTFNSRGFGISQIVLDYVLVEAGGVEPPSGNIPLRLLHT